MNRVILQIDVKWQCRFQQEHFRSPRLRQAAMRCHFILKLMCAFWHGRVGRHGGETRQPCSVLNSVHGYVCIERESVAFIKSSMRMWSNCTKLSINNEPWKRWWQSLYATMHVRCSRSFAWSPISLCSGAFVSSLVRSIHAIRSHFTAWLKTNTVRLTIWTALGKNSIYNASNKICSF